MSIRPNRRWGILIPFLLVAAALAAFMVPRGSSGATLVGGSLQGLPAPNFHLHDQFGKTVTMHGLRGHTVLLTLMQSTCTQLCPGVADSVRRAVEEIGPAGKKVDIIALSADPEHDTPSTIRTFSIAHRLYHRWHYLTAGRTTLAPIWKAFHVWVAPANAPKSLRNAHSSATFLIDSSGRERSVFLGGVSDLELGHDLQVLTGAPVTLLASRSPAPEVGHPAPDFALKSTAGKVISLGSLHGHVVLLNFWASWCHPCRSEMPMLGSWYRKLHAKGLDIVGVNNQDPLADARAFAASVHTPYTILLDTHGTIAARYDVIGMPTTVLVDSSGIVRNIKPGILDPSYLKNQIEPVLAEK
jgi:cytochrome oxidase Cu insertion factor (SCO1/SenC/PrrC family)